MEICKKYDFFVRKKRKLTTFCRILFIGGMIPMAFLSQEKITEIRNSVDIVEIISNYITLTPRGRNYFGVCPFHDDNHPSLSVNREKKIYKCFSCGATGTVFKFIMDYENISFMEAVKKVADIGGMHVDVKTTPKVQIHNKLHDIYDLSLKFYINNINTAAGKEAKAYLANRGITEDIIKEFQIGLALNTKDKLAKLLLKKFDEKDIMESGLVNKNAYGYLDLFYERIMFPLYDLDGNVVAYSGRIYNREDNSKYFNTRETSIFKKGELLYNYHRAKDVARQKNQIIIMEGFMDVIRAYTIGVKNVIATMGTAVTKTQALLIKKMAKEIILCFDGDEAGAKATMACADILLNIGVTPKVIRLEDNMDPDEYIKKYGKEFEDRIKNPISVMDFKLSYLKTGKNLSNPTDEAKYINEAIKEINKIDDDILRELTIKKVVQETGITEELILSKVTMKEPAVIKMGNDKPKVKIDKYEKAERNLIYYMLRSPEVIKMYNAKVTYMPTKEYRLLAREIKMFYSENGFINEADLIDYVECDDDLVKTINKVEEANLNDNYSLEEIEDYIRVIKDHNIKNEINRLTKQMQEEVSPTKKALIAQKIIDLKKECNNV